MSKKLTYALGVALTLSSAACNRHKSSATVPVDRSAQADPVAAPEQPPDHGTMSVTAIAVDRRLAEMCGLPLTEVFFHIDSANLQPEARDQLERIASCLTVGPAREESLVVVGRASPPGSDAYNMELGESRAESVAAYLRQLGVNRSRVEVESKGEREAGLRPESWGLERRVTVRLQGRLEP